MNYGKFTDKAHWRAEGKTKPRMPLGRILMGLVFAGGAVAAVAGISSDGHSVAQSPKIDVTYTDNTVEHPAGEMKIEAKGLSMAAKFAVPAATSTPVPVAAPAPVKHPSAGIGDPPGPRDTSGRLAQILSGAMQADSHTYVPAEGFVNGANSPPAGIPVAATPVAAAPSVVASTSPAAPPSPMIYNGRLPPRKPVLGDAGFAGPEGASAPVSRLGVQYTYVPNLHMHVNGSGEEEVVEGGFSGRDVHDKIGDPSDAFMNVAVLTYLQNKNNSVSYASAVAAVESAQAEARACVESMRNPMRCVASIGGVRFDYGKREFSASLLKSLDGSTRSPSNLMVARETQEKMVALAQFARITTPDYEMEDVSQDVHPPQP